MNPRQKRGFFYTSSAANHLTALAGAFMKRLFFALSSTLLITCISFAKSYIPSGCSTLTSCTETKNKEGELHGPQTCVNYYKKDIVVIKAIWKNDKLEKDFFCTNDDGIPVVQAQYKDGELHGQYKTYNSSEKKWNEPITYKNGKREGIAKLPGSNGHYTVVFYKNDKQHGYELQFKGNTLLYIKDCYVDDTRKEEKDCRNITMPGYDKLIADHIKEKEKKEFAERNYDVLEKYSNGQVKERYKMVNSQISGAYEKFYENGKPQIQRTHKDGYKTEEKIYFREGSLESHSFFNKSWQYKTTLYYQNGQKKLERDEVKSPDDKWLTIINYKDYHDNGKLAEVGRKIKGINSWGDGSNDGEIKIYAKTGELTSLQNYKRGQATGTWKSTPVDWPFYSEQKYEDGKLILDSVFEKNNSKLMQKTEYYPDGSTKSEFEDPTYKEKLKAASR